MSRSWRCLVVPMAVFLALAIGASAHAVVLGPGDILAGDSSTGEIYVTDSGGTTTPVGTAPLAEVTDVAVVGQDIYYSNKVAFGGAHVRRMQASDGSTPSTIGGSPSEQHRLMTAHTNGNIYLTVTDHSIWVFDSALSTASVLVDATTWSTAGAGGDTPAGIIQDPNSTDLLVLESDSAPGLRRVTTAGVVSVDFALAKPTYGDRCSQQRELSDRLRWRR